MLEFGIDGYSSTIITIREPEAPGGSEAALVTFERQCPSARTSSVPPATLGTGAASTLVQIGGALVNSCAFYTKIPMDI